MKRKFYKLISSPHQSLFVLIMVVFFDTAYSQTTYTFNYTGGVQTLSVLGGDYEITCWGADGADGGGAAPPLTGIGGKGGYSKGVYTVPTATTIYIYVGEKGQSSNGTGAVMVTAPGGWNGGGGGFSGSSSSNYKGGGGGATHVASAIGLLSTLAGNQAAVAIVAGGGGGGGGAGSVGYTGSGGNGGGTLGQDGILAASQVAHNGKGGTQSGGGAGGIYSNSMGAAGSFGQGGDGGSVSGNSFPAGGGGGGWYGGGGGATQGGSGGGGSGYIGGVSNGTTIVFGQPGFVTNPDIAGNGYVIITRLCDVSVSASKNPICAGESIILSTNAGTSIQWNTGAITPSITVSPSSTTSYTVSGVSTASTACSSTVSIVVTVHPLPVISMETFPAVFCAAASGSVFATGAQSYTWSNGTSGSSTLVSPTVTSVYTATGTSVQGCKNSGTVSVNVNTNSLTISQNTTTICKGTTINLTAGGVSSVLWSNGSSFLTTPVTPSVTTSYSATGQDALGCMLSNTVTVNVLNLPSITVTSDKQTICRGESVNLTANGGLTYIWDNAETTAAVTKTLNINVPYQFSVTGTDASGCSSTAMITINVSACSGIQENEINTISIFPNPATQQITVSTADKGRKSITVSDLTGRIVLAVKTDESSYKINIEDLPSGVYHVRVKNGDIVKDQKIVKQ